MKEDDTNWVFRRVRGGDQGRKSSQLEGLVDMGMPKEALGLAANILDSPQPTAAEVEQAIRAIGVHAKRTASWRGRIERLIGRLPKRALHGMRQSFLLYFAMIEDYGRASRFIVAPRYFTPEVVYMAVDCLVELGRFEEALDIARMHFVGKAETPDAEDYLVEATAMVACAEKRHQLAMDLRTTCPAQSPIGRNIVEGTIVAGLSFLITHLDTRITALQKLKKEAYLDETQVSIPGNQEGLLDNSEKAYKAWRVRLMKLIPKKQRFRYGIRE